MSDEWLADRATAEKGFSLGFFDERYVARFPIALIERDGHVEAFANVWPGAGGIGAVDGPDAAPQHRRQTASWTRCSPALMQWGREQGYEWFNLGMAPLAGLEESPVAPLWSSSGRFVYGHGETFYNFKGLRTYKEKFHPEWEPHYLAYPGRTWPAADPRGHIGAHRGGIRRIFVR